MAGRGPLIVVVGSVNLDTTMAVERLPAAGETLLAVGTRTSLGGKGANQAVAARRQGIPTAFVGAVGDDDAGRGALAALRAEGVDVTAVARRAGVPTGAAAITVDRHGANTIVVAQGANASLTETDLGAAAALIERASVVMAQLEVTDEVVTGALRMGVAAGAVTVLNPAPARPVPAEMLGACGFLVPNEHEAALLTGEQDPARAAARLAELAPGAVIIVTCGERGALIAGPGAGPVATVGAFPADAVDTVAAGDAFCGVLAAALASGRSLGESVRRASAGGAHAVTIAGATPSLPTAADIDRILGA